MDLTCRGPRVSGMGTRRRFGGRHNSENKMYYQEYAEAFGPTRPGEGQSGLQRGGERGDWLAIKEDWVGPQGRFKETLIFEFQKDLDFDKTERNCIRRFRRDLDMGIFPKFF
jgi:hypothetical protein